MVKGIASVSPWTESDGNTVAPDGDVVAESPKVVGKGDTVPSPGSYTDGTVVVNGDDAGNTPRCIVLGQTYDWSG